jgi:hypothetical protein
VDGRSELVYVFTDDDDPDAEPWTWAQALRYLLYFHLGSGLITWSNVWDQTRSYVTQTSDQRPTPPVIESSSYDGDPATASTLFRYAMLGMPSDAVFEDASIVEAMSIIAKATDTHFRVESDASGDSLIWWARGGGPRREVCKDPTGDTISEVLESLNIEQMTLSVDYGDVITAPIGIGDTRRHEVTVQLVPGWKPDAAVDVPADPDTAVQTAEAHLGSDSPQDDAWFQKYCASGISFPSYANVGRRWVLNETGRYRSSEYARSSGYFTTAKYTAWAPSSCSIVEKTYVNGAWVTQNAAWTRMPRPFLPCFSADINGRSLGVVVEASFDSGSNWERIACKVLATEAGIYIETDDLTMLTSQLVADMHWWKAMCTGVARVRVTAVIEGDGALMMAGEALTAAVSHEASRAYDWRSKFKSNYRTSANSIYAPGGERATAYQTVDCRDDSPAMDQWLASLCELNSMRQIPGTFTIPWLECNRYRIGDCISNVRGVTALQGDVSGGVRRPPDIVAIVYGETSTQLVLEDPGMMEMKA